MGFGRLLWPGWEMGAPQPSPNLSLLSRTADFVSVMRVTDDCDEIRRASDCRRGTSRGLIIFGDPSFFPFLSDCLFWRDGWYSLAGEEISNDLLELGRCLRILRQVNSQGAARVQCVPF
jgi:hypothetical protein